MKMLLDVRMPHEPFNTLVRNGTIGEVIGKVLDAIKPEAAWFSERDGTRGGIFIVDVADSSKIPSIAEPFFLAFEAKCQFHVLMSPEDLGKAGLDEIGKAWK